jgi:hypothetical protein
MSNRNLKAAAAFAAGGFAVYIVGCEDIIGVADEYGTVELIYEYVSDTLSYFYLADISSEGNTYLITAYDESNDEKGLFILEPEASDLNLIFSGPFESGSGWSFALPKLSPDKKNVVFAELSGIYVVPVSGGEPRRIYWQGLQPTPAQWIDDETVLIYVITGSWEIKTVNINTLEVNTLLVYDEPMGGYIMTISLSPDGKYLFLTGERQEGDEFSPSYYYFQIIDTDTWEYEEYRTDCFWNGPWSPDGNRICILEHHPDVVSGYRFYKYYDFTTGEEVPVFYSKKLIFNPIYRGVWSADGTKLLASEKRDDNILRVFAIDAE